MPGEVSNVYDPSHCALALSQAIEDEDLDPLTFANPCVAVAESADFIFISLDRSRALHEVEASARRARADPRLGLPAWKDLIDVAVPVTASGGRAHAIQRSARNAPVTTVSRAGVLQDRLRQPRRQE